MNSFTTCLLEWWNSCTDMATRLLDESFYNAVVYLTWGVFMYFKFKEPWIFHFNTRGLWILFRHGMIHIIIWIHEYTGALSIVQSREPCFSCICRQETRTEKQSLWKQFIINYVKARQNLRWGQKRRLLLQEGHTLRYGLEVMGQKICCWLGRQAKTGKADKDREGKKTDKDREGKKTNWYIQKCSYLTTAGGQLTYSKSARNTASRHSGLYGTCQRSALLNGVFVQ